MEIKKSWEEHVLYKQGVVEMVPTSWVWKYWGRDVTPLTNLHNGSMVDLDDLWKDVQEKGLCDPLTMRVGLKNKKFRLEAGNHMIQIFHQHGVSHVPVTVQVRDECGPHLDDVLTDATHNFDAEAEFLISNITTEYMKPSDVFKSLSSLNDKKH